MMMPPVNRDIPYVSGDGTIGLALHCTMGNWEGEPTSYLYQWQRGNTPVGAGESTYIPTEFDAGFDISCIVTATNSVGSAVAPPSNPVPVVSAIAPPPPQD